MIVASDRRRLLSRRLHDLEPGDFVRRKGHRGVGLVESVANGFAWVAWKDARKDYLPVIALRRVHSKGCDLDVRKP